MCMCVWLCLLARHSVGGGYSLMDWLKALTQDAQASHVIVTVVVSLSLCVVWLVWFVVCLLLLCFWLLLFVVCCLLFVVCFLFFVVFCLLFVVCCCCCCVV